MGQLQQDKLAISEYKFRPANSLIHAGKSMCDCRFLGYIGYNRATTLRCPTGICVPKLWVQYISPLTHSSCSYPFPSFSESIIYILQSLTPREPLILSSVWVVGAGALVPTSIVIKIGGRIRVAIASLALPPSCLLACWQSFPQILSAAGMEWLESHHNCPKLLTVLNLLPSSHSAL